MNIIYLFSSDIERDAAFPGGIPDGVRTAIVGVGIIDAAIGTAAVVEREKPDAVIFVGTCGAHRESGIAIGDMVIASEVSLASGDVALGWMRLPTLLSSSIRADASLMQRLVDQAAARGMSLAPVRVSCTLGITENEELAARLNDFGYGAVENMEAFAVLRAAGQIPAAVVLGVTNIVGPGGGRDWLANYKEMMGRVMGMMVP